MTNQTLTVKSVVEKLQIKETVAVLVFSALIPFMVHFIPTSGAPAGLVLLPIFIAPFISLVFFRWNAAAVAALLSPMLNYLLTGNPVFSMLGLLTVELSLFVALSYFLLKVNGLRYFAAPVSIFISMLAAHLLLSRFDHFTSTFVLAIPGIVLMAIVNVLALALAKRLK